MINIATNLKYSIITFISRIISGSIVFILLARLLTVSEFGLLSFGVSFAGLLTVLAEFGFSLMAQRDIPQNKFPLNDYISNALFQKIFYSFLASVGAFVYLFFTYSGDSIRIGIIFLINAILTSYSMYFFSVLRAKNLFKHESLLSAFYSIFLGFTFVTLFFFNKNVLFLAIGLLVARLVQFILICYFFFNTIEFSRFRLKMSIQKYFFKNSFSFGLHYIIGVFYFTIDSQLIFFYSGEEELAIYQSFFKVILIMLSVSDLLNNIFIPYFSSRIIKRDNLFDNLTLIANKAIIILGLVMFVFINLFAEDIITILYSEKYLSAMSIVLPLSFVLLFRICASFYAILLTISDHQGMRVLVVAISLFVNFFLNIWLIPNYGFIGAAYVSMFTHLIMLILYFWFSSRFNSSLLSPDILLLLIITVFLIFLKSFYKLEFSFHTSLLMLLSWCCIVYIFIGNKQIREMRSFFLERYF